VSRRRLSVSVVVLAAGAVLLVAAALGAGSAEAATGGTLRLGTPVDLKVDPAIAGAGREWSLEFATCAKLFNFPDEEGAAGMRLIPEVAAGFPRVSKDGKTYTFDLKRTSGSIPGPL
jgi:ABC-type oligopeptide transport system substrate-binding subunit